MPIGIQDVLVIAGPVAAASVAWWLGGRQKHKSEERHQEHIDSREWADRYEKLVDKYSALAIKVERLQASVDHMEEEVKRLTAENTELKDVKVQCADLQVRYDAALKEIEELKRFSDTLVVMSEAAMGAHVVDAALMETMYPIVKQHLDPTHPIMVHLERYRLRARGN